MNVVTRFFHSLDFSLDSLVVWLIAVNPPMLAAFFYMEAALNILYLWMNKCNG